ncbi:sensor histidine kinase [Actinoplanes sichuanensis]|uniref:histidine kinase n=1 Tax=Actinoplanes sichuanensis TaxID=512349 RepID=A0ABW4A8L7_9ACTN|nr:sensor histidine kinase [Actinoplanes sichuanensis]
MADGADDPTPPRNGFWRVARIVGTVVLCILAVIDTAVWNTAADGTFWPLVILVPSVAAVIWPVSRRPSWLTPELRAAVPAAASLAFTVGNHLSGGPQLGGPGEALSLLCLLLITIRRAHPARLAPIAALVALAVVALPLRERAADPGVFDDQFGVAAVLALLAAVFSGLGGYLRTVDERYRRRRVALVDARRAERLAMAADLHDFVAHHVTGILVQAQMGQAVLTLHPERLGPILAGIERAAGETLESMRRTVDVLRTEPGTTADGNRTAGDLASLPGLVDGFSRAGPVVTLLPYPDMPEDLPHEVQVAAFRVVQEALTNVRRHGADASEVTVELRYAKRRLTVLVRDNGTTPAPPDVARGTGFGLTGLDERVTALGGRLTAGPRPGGGWELTATLPTTRHERGTGS